METTLSPTGDSPKPTSEDAAGYQNTLLNDHRIAEEVYKIPENNVFLETDTILDSRDDLKYYVGSEKTTTEECQTVPQQTSSKLFENACFKIKESRTAGLGAFAATILKKGDIILRERPLFTATASNVIKAFEKLTGHDKDIALSLHANALLKPGTPRIQAVWKTNW
ncbi:hypothetical protein EsDP_00007369 [Epichloe bromicola]|uniref:Uncharacterized protein n=1 Tax=Epichloe bromicola TaxID=79588 RepID=A0ABQ0D0D8_9HYPO